MADYNPTEVAVLEVVNRAKLLQHAIEAVAAGVDVSLPEAELVWGLTETPGIKRHSGAYHCSSIPECEPFILGGAAIPEAVRLSAVKVLRKLPDSEPESNPFDVKPGPVSLHDYDRFEQIAIELLRENPKNEKGLFDAALAVYMAENPDRPQISPSNAEARRRIRVTIQSARQARIDAE